MTIEARVYPLTAGSKFIFSSELANVTVLRVAREGVGYNRTTSTPFDREYKHTSYDGKIEFMNPGAGNPAVSSDVDERVYVRFKY